MSNRAYKLGLEAGRRGDWFHQVLDQYRSEGLVDRNSVLDFYRGYWGDLFEVRYENGRIRLLNRSLK